MNTSILIVKLAGGACLRSASRLRAFHYEDVFGGFHQVSFALVGREGVEDLQPGLLQGVAAEVASQSGVIVQLIAHLAVVSTETAHCEPGAQVLPAFWHALMQQFVVL